MNDRSRGPAWKITSWGKLLGLPMGCDVCYTNHADADQNRPRQSVGATRNRRRELRHGRAVCRRRDVELSGVLSYHDALYIRDLFGLKRAPEFDDWLVRSGLADADFRLAGNAGLLPEFASRLIA